jgi:succinate dehydrogenase/fumarate reductase cytochrome b subunit
MNLRKLHGLSALVVAAFVLVHIANHLAGLAGPDVHIAFMKTARSIYRFRVVEIVLLGCVAFQIVSGLTLLVRGWKQRQGFVAWVQAISGALLAFFLIVHVASVL